MSIALLKTVNFGASKSGLAAVGYTLLNTDESEKQARTTTGVYELGTNTGLYACDITFDDDWNGSILWDSGEGSPVYAAEEYNDEDEVKAIKTKTDNLPADTDGTLTTLQADVTIIKKIETGRWKIVNNQMIFYDDDGTTPLYTFNLKNADGDPTEDYPRERVIS